VIAVPPTPGESDASSERPARWGVVPWGGLSGHRAHLFREGVVRIAVTPVLPGLERAHHRVFRLVEMTRRVSVRRVVTTTHVATLEAQPEMHPDTTVREAIDAALGARVDRCRTVGGSVEVRAGVGWI